MRQIKSLLNLLTANVKTGIASYVEYRSTPTFSSERHISYQRRKIYFSLFWELIAALFRVEGLWEKKI